MYAYMLIIKQKSMNDIPLPEDLKERATAKVASRMDRLNKTGESWRMNREAEDVEDGSSVDKVKFSKHFFDLNCSFVLGSM